MVLRLFSPWFTVSLSVALQVLDTMMSTPSTSTGPRSFVYISAADCFRPIIPSKYIETKRQAEFGIRRKVEENPESRIVPAFIRPGELKAFSPR